MANDNQKNINKLLVALVVLLVAATGVQGFYLFKVYHAAQNPSEVEASAPRRDASKAAAPSGHSFGNMVSIDPDDLWVSSNDEWDPFGEMRRLQEQMNRLFDDSFGRFRLAPGFSADTAEIFFSPRFDMKEEEDRYVIKMDIPGADQSNLNIQVDDRLLTVTGSTEETVEEKDGNNILRKERRSGRFQRSVSLPGPVRSEEMKADYNDGVLTLTFPREAGKPSKKLTINEVK